MKIEDVFTNHGMVEKSITHYYPLLLREIIENRASEKDNLIKNQLLKKLVLDYSIVEQKLVELNELKNKFLGMAAHDMRNPLTSIRGFSELLLEDKDSLTEEQIEMLTIISSASDNMLALLSDLLDISAIESGKLSIHFQKGSLQKVIEDTVKINRMVARKKKIRLHTSLFEIPDIDFDEDRIVQVIDNLISNAIKFSPVSSNIYISLKQEENTAKVSVKDEGPGISPEDQSKLSGEFQKLSTRPTGGEKSTGLGLAIVKKILDAHHGTVEVESQVGKGSTFSFKIPIKN